MHGISFSVPHHITTHIIILTIHTNIDIPTPNTDFGSLMKRMVKEKYVLSEREEARGEGEHNRTLYRFGPRYFAELGRQQIITSYYKCLGQQIDKNVLDEVSGTCVLYLEEAIPLFSG